MMKRTDEAEEENAKADESLNQSNNRNVSQHFESLNRKKDEFDVSKSVVKCQTKRVRRKTFKSVR